MAVIAIDPSSPITGGAILGDRVRMQQHATDPDVFIRSMASRGHVGGLATSTVAAAAVLDASGFPLVFIETVGTGQSEVEVAAIADTTLVVQAPEMGDEVQAIKAGPAGGGGPGGRHQRGPAGRRPGRLAPAGDAHRRRAARPRHGRPATPEAAGRGAGLRPDTARASRTCWPRWTGGTPRTSTEGDASATRARVARAEAQILGILAERLQARLHDPANGEVMAGAVRAVAAHELDPYAAADQLPAETADARRFPGRR